MTSTGLTFTGWLVLVAVVVVGLAISHRTRGGVTERVRIQTTLSNRNPFLWTLIGIFAFLILKYIYLWKM